MKSLLFAILFALYVMIVLSCSKELVLPNQITLDVASPQTANKGEEQDWAGTTIYNPCTDELMRATSWKVTISMLNTGKNLSITQVKAISRFVGISGKVYNGNLVISTHSITYKDGVNICTLILHERIHTAGSLNDCITIQKYTIKFLPNNTYEFIRDPVMKSYCK